MFGRKVECVPDVPSAMSGFRSLIGGVGGAPPFDGYDEFVPGHLPEPGEALEAHDVLAGPRHAAFHRLTRALFEERAVYDMTFGYNLARLNLDPRHSDAGYRYAEEREPAAETGGDADRVLRAEFTPTTPFCPQSDTLTRGSFRAWNGLGDRHEYDLVRVRVSRSHHRAAEINGALRPMEAEFLESGTIADAGATGPDEGPDREDPSGGTIREYALDAPF